MPYSAWVSCQLRRAGSADDVVETIFTSGTTSRPKGVLLTHSNSLFGGAQAASAMHLDSTDRLLTALPVFHVNAQPGLGDHGHAEQGHGHGWTGSAACCGSASGRPPPGAPGTGRPLTTP